MTQPYDEAGRYQMAGTTDDTSTTDVAKAHAQGMADDAKEHARNVAGTAGAEARDVAEHAKQEARGLLGQAQGELHSQAGTQQQRLAGLMREVSTELSGILDPHNSTYQRGLVSDVAEQAGARLQSATSWLEGRDPQDVMTEVSRFARRRPGTFLAIAAVAGLMVGRVSRGMADDARRDDAPRGLAQGYAPYGTAYGTTDYSAPTGAAYDTGYGYPAPTGTSAAGFGAGSGTYEGGTYSTGQDYAAPAGQAPAYGAPVGGGAVYGEDETRRFPTTSEPEHTFRPDAGTYGDTPYGGSDR